MYSQTVFGGGGAGFDGGGAAGQFVVDGAPECDELDVDLYLANHYENMLHTAIEECGKLVFDFCFQSEIVYTVTYFSYSSLLFFKI